MNGDNNGLYGLVAFFDILGYKQILKKNDILYVINLTNKIIKVYENEIINKFEGFPDDSFQGIMRPFLKFAMNRIISDSVIYCLPLGISKSPVVWIGFLSICKAFMWRMFIEGLPVRCGIACGDYFVDDNVIAGKPIADACEVCNSQDWTGGSFSKSCIEEINNLNRNDMSFIMFDRLVIPYATPFKKSPENECQYAIDWIDYLELKEYKNIDLKQLIVDKFNLHGKTIGDAVTTKIDNTYNFLKGRIGNL